LVDAIRSRQYSAIICNFANGDMVGHTGVAAAIRIAVEAVDLGLRRLVAAVQAARGVLVVTADHGNADCMFTEKNGTREPMVAHTLNPVPFIVKDFSGANRLQLAGVRAPGLSHVAATLLCLLGFQKPPDYDASLITLA
jgi:2,3-bisphosphoglycerate-independent phosphoglycerate mutase